MPVPRLWESGLLEVVVAARQLRTRRWDMAVSSQGGRGHVGLSSYEGRHLHLLGEFVMSEGRTTISVPTNVERLMAFLAIHDTPQTRTKVATVLWIDTAEPQAAARLRAALWRVEKVAPGWLVREGSRIALSEDVSIDLHDAIAQSMRLTECGATLKPGGESFEHLRRDLLPHWEEEWLLFERERVRQLRVHALEALCHLLTDCDQLAQAIDAGLAAVACEPLRESAHRALISAHLAEGNVSEARRQFFAYRDLLGEQLGISPTETLRDLALGPVTIAG